MAYSIQHIARITAAEPIIVSDTNIEHLITDSRKTYSPASSLFFALSGARKDGHQFIRDLYKKGVRNFVISKTVINSFFPEANFLLVKDVLDALQQLAAWHRQQFRMPVIAITGSNGKTIIKEWLYQLLHEDYSIVRSPKSYNSQIGVPLSVWQMDAQHELAIFEAGISQPGEMAKLETIIRPTIGILTNIGEAHSEGFRNKEAKLLEKIALFKNTDWIICFSKYDPFRKIDELCEAVTVYCGEQPDDDIQVLSVQKEKDSTSIAVRAKHKFTNPLQEHSFSFTIPFTDEASIDNAILCMAVMWVCTPVFNPEIDTIKKRLSVLSPVEMRLELKKGINNCAVINDSYSADLSSLEIALNFLDQQSTGKKKTVILSDFLQSGLRDGELYSKIAAALKNHAVHKIIGVGERISKFLPLLYPDPAISQEYFSTTGSFIQHYRFSQFREEMILVKGARTFAFEEVVQLLEQKVHQTVLEINLNAIVHNLKEYQRIIQPSTKVMAMVKAFAYGSGGAEIAGILQYHKVDYLGVAYADEGVELRKAGITIPIMVMNPEENAFESIIENTLEPEIYSFELLHAFDKFLQREGLQHYPVHIEIETGMNRLGFATTDIPALAQALQSTSSFNIQSVFSHLAASEETAQDEFTLYQYDLFDKAARELEQKTGYSFIKHIANSAAAIRHPQLQMDMVRLGIGLYGVDTSGMSSLNLQTVATLKSTIAQIKHIKKGESVSYNRKAIVDKDSVIATIRIGYADGYPRRLSNGAGKVALDNKLLPVIGTVCMDMFMIDITGIPGVKEGDEVIIFGAPLPVQQIAQWANTIPYEIMTGVSQRVKRVYYEE